MFSWKCMLSCVVCFGLVSCSDELSDISGEQDIAINADSDPGTVDSGAADVAPDHGDVVISMPDVQFVEDAGMEDAGPDSFEAIDSVENLDITAVDISEDIAGDVAPDVALAEDLVVAPDLVSDTGDDLDVSTEEDVFVQDTLEGDAQPVDAEVFDDAIVEEDAGGSPLDCEALVAGNTLEPYVSGCSDGSREGFLNAGAYPNLAACGGAWDVPGIHHPESVCGHEAGNDGVNPMGVGCNVADICAEGWHVCLGKDDVLAHNPSGCAGIMDCAESPAFFLVRTSSIGAFYCAPDTIGDPASQNDLFGCGDLGCPTKQFVCEGNLSLNNQTKCTPGEPCATCTGSNECQDGSNCIAGPCNPLTLGSHNLCKGIKNKPTSNCQCYFYGELPETDPKYVEGDFENVVCQPGSGGCGWCKPLDYFAKKAGLAIPDTWDCGNQSASEALNVVKNDPYQQGGVLCCRDF